jgi:hypothetical protein
MQLFRRKFLSIAAGVAGLPADPERPVRMIVGFPPGATADIVGSGAPGGGLGIKLATDSPASGAKAAI